MDIETIKQRLQLPPLKDYETVLLALSHNSYTKEAHENQPQLSQKLRLQHKRLAHLGDGIMNAAVTDYLFHEFPDADQGNLTQKSQPLKERRKGAYWYALHVGLDQICRVGGSINETAKKGDMFGEMFEALMGAIYLESDRNFSVARDWFHDQCGVVIEQQISRKN
ncbi:hypothetical protein H6F93_00035 [Leptolyngbya sp. FACHB-671]|uniref:ribonuclease III domain-containing protein n=1 Tax=Leptolyngbya sp. FACHB-671 TaxID=2692812 RepID=UPI00168848B9|nr:hypothetical protein [Leptolyngbya sp. FACHB-671]